MGTLWSHGTSDIGTIRPRNEDRIFFDDALRLYIVCDGIGGRRHGGLAAEIAAETIRESIRSPPSPEPAAARLQAAVAAANRQVWSRGEESLEFLGMGTTVAAVLIDGPLAAVANLGDSRVYLYRGAQLRQLSVDHIAARDLRDVLTRAAGWEENVEVQITETQLAGEDQLLLCSDGLHGHVPDDQIARILETPGSLDSRVAALIAAARAAGSSDNVSAVLVQYRSEPQPRESPVATSPAQDPSWRETAFDPKRYATWPLGAAWPKSLLGVLRALSVRPPSDPKATHLTSRRRLAQESSWRSPCSWRETAF